MNGINEPQSSDIFHMNVKVQSYKLRSLMCVEVCVQLPATFTSLCVFKTYTCCLSEVQRTGKVISHTAGEQNTSSDLLLNK